MDVSIFVIFIAVVVVAEIVRAVFYPFVVLVVIIAVLVGLMNGRSSSYRHCFAATLNQDEVFTSTLEKLLTGSSTCACSFCLSADAKWSRRIWSQAPGVEDGGT